MPPRSPVLNVLDYSLWSEISKRMRRQEQDFHNNKKESKVTFLARLRRTALMLPPSVVEKAVGNMAKRSAYVRDAEGQLFKDELTILIQVATVFGCS